MFVFDCNVMQCKGLGWNGTEFLLLRQALLLNVLYGDPRVSVRRAWGETEISKGKWNFGTGWKKGHFYGRRLFPQPMRMEMARKKYGKKTWACGGNWNVWGKGCMYIHTCLGAWHGRDKLLHLGHRVGIGIPLQSGAEALFFYFLPFISIQLLYKSTRYVVPGVVGFASFKEIVWSYFFQACEWFGDSSYETNK